LQKWFREHLTVMRGGRLTADALRMQAMRKWSLRSWLKTAEVYLEGKLVRMISMRVPVFTDLGLYLMGSLIITLHSVPIYLQFPYLFFFLTWSPCKAFLKSDTVAGLTHDLALFSLLSLSIGENGFRIEYVSCLSIFFVYFFISFYMFATSKGKISE
jgi:hypothetical protein